MAGVVQTDGLSKCFGKLRAVNNLKLDVPEGSIYAFLGPNGAGKTTTIKLLMNIIKPTGGSSSVLGVNSGKLDEET
jgi:ABC-2 type transport system ATP-binding protein